MGITDGLSLPIFA